jgi:hypothetical protein
MIAAAFGEAQTLVIVGIIYGFVLGPIALVIQGTRGDPLQKRGLRAPGTAWLDADSTAAPDVERAKRLF